MQMKFVVQGNLYVLPQLWTYMQLLHAFQNFERSQDENSVSLEVFHGIACYNKSWFSFEKVWKKNVFSSVSRNELNLLLFTVW